MGRGREERGGEGAERGGEVRDYQVREKDPYSVLRMQWLFQVV